LYCQSTNSLFLRANGSFTCWDDAGSRSLLLDFDPERDMSEVYSRLGPCGRIAEALAGDRMPFPSICPDCFSLSFEAPPAFDGRLVDQLQVEPSAVCTLECLACSTKAQRLERTTPPRIMPVERFAKILSDFRRKGIDIRCIDFRGHGEPLLNPALPQLIRLSRESYPKAMLTLCTNAHGKVTSDLVSSGIGLVECAIDGVDQESLEKYRIGGDYALALGFMRDLQAESDARKAGIRIVWRYILFAHNDSQEQLREAWRIAADLGIAELRFILTHKGMWSRRLLDGDDVGAALLAAGVPPGRLRISTHESLEKKRNLVQHLRRNRHLFSLARAVRRLRRAGVPAPAGRSAPVVTCAYDLILRRNLERGVLLGRKLLRRGRIDDARSLYMHVNRMLERPGRCNPTYVVPPGDRLFGRVFEELGLASDRD
jgi:MoaA/NifB/PqqE/SkfB family radical SAM enzyme